jgi:cobalt/nickel transport system permease protein
VHIPDGFIAPQMYAAAYAASAGLSAYAAHRIRKTIREETIPLMGVMTALAFGISLIAVPLPGGTSVHATGIGLLAVLFGVWASFLSLSLVLLLQALLFGMGGITSFPVNAIAMGLFGSAAGYAVFAALRRASLRAALFAAGFTAVVVPAIVVALALGAQPHIAHRADGTPLFFPFGFRVTIPAVVLPHLLVGAGEGVLTVLVYGFVSKLRKRRS